MSTTESSRTGTDLPVAAPDRAAVEQGRPSGALGCSRRRVLAGGALGAAGLALAGCGPKDSATPARSGADGSIRVPTADTGVGGITYYSDAKVVVTQPTEGEFHAFGAICPHQGCPASDSQDGRIVCPCHGSVFDATTGAPLQGPATTGLEQLAAQTDGADLVIRG